MPPKCDALYPTASAMCNDRWYPGRQKSSPGMTCSSNTLVTLFALCRCFQQTPELNPDLIRKRTFFPCRVFYECHHKLICGRTVVAVPTSLLWLCNNHGLTQWQRLEGPSGGHLVKPQLQAQSAGAGSTRPRPVLKISEDRDSTASLGNLCPCLITLLKHPSKLLGFFDGRAHFMINPLPTNAAS